MITDIEVEDYQAVRKASIKLGKLTVVTGPTGSGKSAIIRAMGLVTFNARGTAFIKHGAKLCQAALGFRDENIVVAITRGGRGKDAYRLVWKEGDSTNFDNRNGVQFTKLAGGVPPEVSEILQLSEINFAGQFDRPYLLTESGSQVARVLGELTNVTLVLDAAREANRRKLETGAELKRAEARLADLKEQAKGFRGLKDRLAAAQDARDRLDSMEFISDQHHLLDAAWLRWRQAQQLRDATVQNLERATPPSAERMTELAGQWEHLITLAGNYDSAREDLDSANDDVRNWHAAHVAESAALHDALVAAGTCPTCGQVVSAV